jgi:hypothetical protein
VEEEVMEEAVHHANNQERRSINIPLALANQHLLNNHKYLHHDLIAAVDLNNHKCPQSLKCEKSRPTNVRHPCRRQHKCNNAMVYALYTP